MKKWLPLYIMMLPGALYFIINNYIPMFGLIIAFKKMDFSKGIFGSEWVGFRNFEFLFSTSDAFVITRNTLLYNMAFIIINMVLGITLAIFIADVTQRHMKKIYQSAILLPFLMSMVILGYIVYAFLSMQNGIVNNSILPIFGKDPIFWYNEAKHWPYILVIANTWKTVGYGCLIYIAAINGIDPSLFEAARIDGANKIKQIFYITIPSLVPTIVTLLIMSIGRIFYSDFGLFYQVPRNAGLLYPTTNVVDTYVYRGLMELGNVGMASAAGFYQSIVGFILVLSANMIIRKVSKENALF